MKTTLLITALLLSLAPFREEESKMEEKMQILENEFFYVTYNSLGILTLKTDPNGKREYGENLVASGEILTGTGTPILKENCLHFSLSEEIRWPLPFVRSGFYDADMHLIYPQPMPINAIPHIMPIRKFLTSNGQTLLIEYFMRLPVGEHPLWLNLNNGNSFAMVLDPKEKGVIEVRCPGQNATYLDIRDNKLQLHWKKTSQPATLVVHKEESQLNFNVLRPYVNFTPSFEVIFDETRKKITASPLATDMLQMGMLWHPSIVASGEWILEAIRTFKYVDTRTSYDDLLRHQLLSNLSYIGYDRFEHFGMVFNWGCYPDYGAGALLNIPANNAPYDMRFLHVNAMQIIAATEYILATGDTSILYARAERYVETDGAEPQPLCGKNPDVVHHVLAAGDLRLDGKKPQKIFSLGQSFRAQTPFRQITLLLGTGQVIEGAPSEVVAKIWIKRLSDSRILLEEERNLPPATPVQRVTLQLSEEAPPGEYEVRVSDKRSGVYYFGPGIFWHSREEGNYKDGEALWGPFSGDLYEKLKMVFNYLYEYTGGKVKNLSYNQDDREFNIENQKSGRPLVSMQNSYHECLGGGYDVMMALWYPPACQAMATLATIRQENDAAKFYLDLHKKAIDVFNETFWYEVTENGKKFRRYFGSRDWDGVIHDYGFTYYNLEAADFEIPDLEKALDILWWLDTGYWRPEPEAPWQEDIYSIWQIAAPFNTIEIDGWVGITGKLPYREVLTNGGTRLSYAARDITVRSKFLSIDNMHERCKQILARYASPDRLTGGRIVDDPGGRGRWHFGEPHVNRADIEGFREFFTCNGSLVEAFITSYLGTKWTPNELILFPRVPSSLTEISLGNIGYHGCMFCFDIKADRTQVPIDILSHTENSWEFKAQAPFSKVGIQIQYDDQNVPFKKGALVELVLEYKGENNKWTQTGRNWMRYLRNDDWVWVNPESSLPPENIYRLRIATLRLPHQSNLQDHSIKVSHPTAQWELRSVKVDPVYRSNNQQILIKTEKEIIELDSPKTIELKPSQRMSIVVKNDTPNI